MSSNTSSSPSPASASVPVQSAVRLSSKASIEDISLTNQRVIIRVDFNVPMKDGQIKDTNRIDEVLPTIEYCIKSNIKSIVLISHLGRPDGCIHKKYSLQPLIPYLSQKLNKPIQFLPNCVGPDIELKLLNPPMGSIFLLENLRFHIEEEGKGKSADGKLKLKADKELIKKFRSGLSKYGDLYINDAFGTCHRGHSSIVGINLPIKAAGFLLQKELNAFSRVLENPKRPYLAILGGAKVADKIQLIDQLLDKVDSMIIGGGMAFTFKKILNNIKIGNSLFDMDGSKIVMKLIEKANKNNVKLYFPIDYMIGDKFSKDCKIEYASDSIGGIKDGFMGLDIGPKSSILFSKVIWNSKTIVLNGPMGVFEFPAFASGTVSVLQSIVAATQLGGSFSIVGGGDSASAAKEFGLDKLVSHVSTGGGAALELLEGKQLPGIVALSEKTQKSKL